MRCFGVLGTTILIGSLGGCPSGSPRPIALGPPDASEAGVKADAVVDAGDDARADAGAPKQEAPKQEAPKQEEGMLLVEGGTFRMGADSGGEGDERPAHDVTLKSFWLDVTEVTQAAYDECVAAKACAAPDAAILASFGGLFKGPKKPVIGITWFSARDYCKWKGKRLPREAEYERAVRGSDGRRHPWGNEPPTHERTVFEANATEDVGTHPAGRGPYGHDDLAGNVWEWIEDDYDPFAYRRSGAPEGKPGTCEEIIAAQNQLRRENKQGFTGSNPIPTECEKSIRGGAYNYPAGGLRSTNRIHHPPSFKLRMTGARCAKDAG
ncbi:MAG: formylglycine-generating enzyme family protein [Labilithrix sp.]|nr:formylglycine-generating enzyme family protein [Labilithrix sp.]